MDVNDLRIAVTLIGLVLFLALVAHTWSRRRQADHSAAAALPFIDDEGITPGPVPAQGGKQQGERRE
jgi:cytochrome c oxidase cbb3-type subunit 4